MPAGIGGKEVRITCLTLASFLAMLAGCARFHSRPLSPAETADAFDRRTLDSTELRTFLEQAGTNTFETWPPASWDFEQLSLVAFFYHPDLAVARAQLGIAEAGGKTAAQRPNPTLSVSPGRNTTTSMASPWLLVSSLDIPIETGGKRGYRMLQARRLSDAARLNIAATAWQVRSTLRGALLEEMAAEQKARLLEAQLNIQQEILKRIRQQVEAGALARNEEAPLRIAEAKARVDFSDARRQAIDARSRMAESIGVPLQALSEVKLSGNPFPPLDLQELSSDTLRRKALHERADIRASLANYAAAEAALQLEIAKQYPDVHLQPGYEFDQGDNKWSLGLTVELPVLHQNQGPIAEAEARRVEAAEKFKALQAKVIAEIDRALAGWKAGETNLTTLEHWQQTERERQTNIEQAVQAGAAEQVDLLNSRLEMAVSDLAVSDAKIKLQQAAGALEDALQRPLTLNLDLFQSARQP